MSRRIIPRVITAGALFVELSDVTLTAPAANEQLKYNATAAKWINFTGVLSVAGRTGAVTLAQADITGLLTSSDVTHKSLLLSDLTASKVVVSDGTKKLISGSNTDVELAAAVSASHARLHSITDVADHTFPGGGTTFLRDDGTFQVVATHAAVTLDVNAETLLSLSTQELGLDTQTANLVFAGPTTGAAAAPTFRALVAADISGLVYADRGDPAAYDYSAASFTKDGAWHDLDLSAIVPAGAKFVAFNIDVQADLITQPFLFRKNGNANSYNVTGGYTVGANVLSRHYCFCACDANRVIEYFFINTPTVWATTNVLILGWVF